MHIVNNSGKLVFMGEKSLTSKEIAQYCQVTQRTVVQWINEDKLKSFRTLGKHIRVNRDDFLEFLKLHQMPIPQELVRQAQRQGQKRILIVDDDAGMVDAIKRVLLKEKGFELDVAYDGFEAGRKFAENKPNLIILDINMPGLNGQVLCAKIRKDPGNNDVKILFISGITRQEEIERVISLGANDYLSKPFENKELLSKISRLFNWNRRMDDHPRV